MKTNALPTRSAQPNACAQSPFFERFGAWLSAGGYSRSAVAQYCHALQVTLACFDSPLHEITLADLDQAQVRLDTYGSPEVMPQIYRMGLRKLRQFLGETQPGPAAVNWAQISAVLPAWLVDHLRAYLVIAQSAGLPTGVSGRSGSC